jgi:N-acetylmuramoyl-L-alanine amidase
VPEFEQGSDSLARSLEQALQESGIEATRYRAGRLLPLEGLQVPSVIFSAGFLTNQREGNLLSQAFYQRLLGRAVAQGVYEYLKAREIAGQ